MMPQTFAFCAGRLGGPTAGTGVGEGLSKHIIVQAAPVDEEVQISGHLTVQR